MSKLVDNKQLRQAPVSCIQDDLEKINFWKRLESFVKDVQTGCCAGEEEKQMILHVCDVKLKRFIDHPSKCSCKKAKFTRTVDSDFNPLCGGCGLPI